MNKQALIDIIFELTATRITVPSQFFDAIVSDMEGETVVVEAGENDSFIRYYQEDMLVNVGSCFEWEV